MRRRRHVSRTDHDHRHRARTPRPLAFAIPACAYTARPHTNWYPPPWPSSADGYTHHRVDHPRRGHVQTGASEDRCLLASPCASGKPSCFSSPGARHRQLARHSCIDGGMGGDDASDQMVSTSSPDSTSRRATYLSNEGSQVSGVMMPPVLCVLDMTLRCLVANIALCHVSRVYYLLHERRSPERHTTQGPPCGDSHVEDCTLGRATLPWAALSSSSYAPPCLLRLSVAARLVL
jgi:hypothetical protein